MLQFLPRVLLMKNNKVHPDLDKQDEESTQQEEIVKNEKLEVMKSLQFH